MLGVYLHSKRHLFFEFASKNALEFTEIFDITDTELISTFNAIITDAPAEVAGAFEVIDISQSKDLAELNPFVFGIKQTEDISSDKLRYAAFAYFKCVYDNCFTEPITTFFDTEPAVIERPNVCSVQVAREESLSSLELVPTVIPEKVPCVQELTCDVDEDTKLSKSKQVIAVSQSRRLSSQSSQSREVTRRTLQDAHIRPKRSSAAIRDFQVPIITISSITDKTGTSTISYLLAHTIAYQRPNSKILYLDLNVSNPNSIADCIGMAQTTDASVINLMTLTEADFMQNIALLTETVSLGVGAISIITMGQASLSMKRQLAQSNFQDFLLALSNNYDLVIVDIGKLQISLEYQFNLLKSHVARNIILADASDSRLINTFVQTALELPRNYDIVLNKYMHHAGSFIINQKLKQPLATINMHRNLNSVIQGRISLEDTVIYKELSVLGGII